MPERIQRRRTKGWRLPQNAVIVDRTSRWGNPFTVAQVLEADMAETVEDARRCVTDTFRSWLADGMEDGPEGSAWSGKVRRRIQRNVYDLRGKDLACPCPLPEPGQPDHCHAAVLLEMANDPEHLPPADPPG